MGSYTVAPGDIGVHEKKLVASTVDTVTFAGRDLTEVEILSDGTADIYVRVGGQPPTIAGSTSWRILSAMGSSIIPVDTSGDTIVKLISAGTPTYSVSRTR